MGFYYWFCNTMGWLNFVGGVILGAIGWKRYGTKIEKIWKNLNSK